MPAQHRLHDSALDSPAEDIDDVDDADEDFIDVNTDTLRRGRGTGTRRGGDDDEEEDLNLVFRLQGNATANSVRNAPLRRRRQDAIDRDDDDDEGNDDALMEDRKGVDRHYEADWEKAPSSNERPRFCSSSFLVFLILMGFTALLLYLKSREPMAYHGLSNSPPTEDYYKILHIDRQASGKDIAKSYRKLAMKYHPDKNDDCADCAEKFDEVSRAYQTLSDPATRRVYDQWEISSPKLQFTNSFELTAENSDQVFGYDDYFVVITYLDWHKQCINLATQFNALADKYATFHPHIRFATVNVFEQSPLCSLFPCDISLLPGIHLISNGEIINSKSFSNGVASKGKTNSLQKFIEEGFPTPIVSAKASMDILDGDCALIMESSSPLLSISIISKYAAPPISLSILARNWESLVKINQLKVYDSEFMSEFKSQFHLKSSSLPRAVYCTKDTSLALLSGEISTEIISTRIEGLLKKRIVPFNARLFRVQCSDQSPSKCILLICKLHEGDCPGEKEFREVFHPDGRDWYGIIKVDRDNEMEFSSMITNMNLDESKLEFGVLMTRKYKNKWTYGKFSSNVSNAVENLAEWRRNLIAKDSSRTQLAFMSPANILPMPRTYGRSDLTLPFINLKITVNHAYAYVVIVLFFVWLLYPTIKANFSVFLYILFLSSMLPFGNMMLTGLWNGTKR